MTDDLVIRIRRSLNDPDLSVPPQYLQTKLLQELSIMFSRNGYSLESFNICTASLHGARILGNRLIIEEMQYDRDEVRSIAFSLHEKLNLEQLAIYD